MKCVVNFRVIVKEGHSMRKIKVSTIFVISIFIVSALLMLSDNSVASSVSENSGLCGDNMKWSYDPSTGSLVISGIGEMNNYDVDGYGSYRKSSAPWGKKAIENVTFKGNIQTIGTCAFF